MASLLNARNKKTARTNKAHGNESARPFRGRLSFRPRPHLRRARAAIGAGAIQPNATASRLEHRSTKLAVVKARNPLETMSRLRIRHLPTGCSSEFIKAL